MIRQGQFGIVTFVNTAPYGAVGAFTFTGSGENITISQPPSILRAFPQSRDGRDFPNTRLRAFPIT